ncbi:MAG: precorrin-6y C5,15-methyltransferase (decarboxylating) subunit CbiE [Prevotella sp.]|nr:precorrin-6y C5,15-methyltransferase (decarboxylating) subunit CbiE [Prevotella sp.]
MKFIVIGISDNPAPWFPPKILEIIQSGIVFSGGKRHHEIVAPLLPENAEWIDIIVPLDAVFEKYRSLSGVTAEHTVIVFASGDPLFFGFANTIMRKMPEAEIVVYPTFNSLQLLAHRLVMPYHDMRIVSLTGRPWLEFDRVLIEQAPKIGILTDKEHTPAAIAQRMLEYGYKNYIMHVGEHLGNPEQERVTTHSLVDATHRDFAMPNCVIIAADSCTAKIFGIPDKAFALLDGREKMITKMPIRLLTLQSLELPRAKVFWDIGACTGSVSIEARLLFTHLRIVAFEVRPECEAIIHENCRRHGASGIDVHIGDFLMTDINDLPRPDAVFIGGHGGRLKDIMTKVLTVLSPGGIIIFNSVTSPKVSVNSRQLWDETCDALSLRQEPPLRILLNDHNPIVILKASSSKTL